MVKGRTLRQAALEGATPFPSSRPRSSPPKDRANGSRSPGSAREDADPAPGTATEGLPSPFTSSTDSVRREDGPEV